MDSTRPVLHVITRLESGGAPRSVIELLDGLTKLGVNVELATGLTPPPARDLLPEAEALGIPVHVIPSLRRAAHPWRDLRALLQLRRLIRRLRPQLVHVHTSKAGFLGRLAARMVRRTPCVYTPRGTILEGYFSRSAVWLFTRLDRLAAGWTDRIIGLTQEESESYIEAGIGRPEQHLTIPVGIDAERFTPVDEDRRRSLRAAAGLKDDEVLIAWVGRLVPVKDPLALIRGLSRLADSGSDWRCWIVGEGPLEEEVRELVEAKGLGERVELRGHTEDIPGVMRIADLFVLTSANEGLGRVLLEAMASHLPVVATEVGGVPTVLMKGKAGILVRPGDPEALAAALRPLISSREDRRRWADAGREAVRSAFDLQSTIRKHIQVYEDVLAARMPTGRA
jgi:glycosyltransferase involved in cell wall biosynthesis